MIIIDGKEEARLIKENLKEIIEKENLTPKLVVLQIGDDERSNVYIRNKRVACEKVGISFELKKYDENIEESELIKEINLLNNDSNIHGIILQLPIPEKYNQHTIINTIDCKKDVDGLTDINLGKLFSNNEYFASCTPSGILYLLKKYNIPLSGKKVTIVGRSNLVGKPLSLLLLRENATVTICHSKTVDLKSMTKNADVLISATGHKHLIESDMVSDNCTIIDVGITNIEGHIYGDVDFENVCEKTSYITPVPGGIGPMTVAMLLSHVVKSCREKKYER